MKTPLLFFLCIFSCTFKSCAKQPTEPPKKVLRLNFNKAPPTLDPRKGGDPISSTFQFMLFEGLTSMTKESTSNLALAERVEISDDFKIYEFHLREVYWSDGTPITAFDFERSWKEMLTPNFPCPNSHLLFPIKNAQDVKNGILPVDELGVVAINDKLLRVDLENPTPYFLELTSFCALFAVPHSHQQNCPYLFDASNPHFPVSGAFKIKTWKPGYEMILEKNPDYYLSQKVEIDEIKISFVSDETTTYNLFENQEIDLLGGFFGDIPLEEAQNLKEQNKLQTVSIGSTTFCSFNLDKFPFNNINIRKAFSYALNRSEIVRNILQFDEILTTGCIPPFMKKGLITEYVEDGNIELAKYYFQKGLEELGIDEAGFPEIVMTLSSASLQTRVALAIQSQLQDVLGINLRLEPLDFKVYIDKINSKNHKIALCSIIIQYNDIMNILERFRFKSNPKNFSGFENPIFSSKLNDSCKSNLFDQRLQSFLDAEKILLDDFAIIGLYHSNFVYIKQDPIQDFYVSPIGSMHLNFIKIQNQVEVENKSR